MSEWIGLLKLTITLSFGLALAILIVLAMPKSPLRDAILPYAKLGFALLCGIYALSPIDMFPEIAFGPLGLIDDVGAVIMGVNAARTAFSKPKEERAA